MVQDLLIGSCVLSIMTCENLTFASLATFKARSMLDCSSCTRLPCVSIVAVMLKMYKKLLAVFNTEIRQQSQSYTAL